MAVKIHFTKRALESAACPAGDDRVYLYDTQTRGLALLITSSGSKSFYVYRRVGGRPERIRLGGFPDLSVEQARQAAEKVNGEIAVGKNPQAERRKLRAEATLDDLFQHYMKTHAKVYKRERSWEDDEKQYERYLTGWKTRRLRSIERADIKALHAKVGRENGPYAANRLLAMLSKVFNVAADIGYDQGNPCHGVKKFREESRERYLTPDELPRFIEALNAEPNDLLRDFFWTCLLTGARRGNVQAMTWAQVNLDGETWTIPARRAKGGYAITVPLSEPAVAILRRRRTHADEGEYVFPSYGKSGHLSEPKAAWKALLKRANIADLRIHDLRRTLGSWQAATGASLPIIGKTLGHRNVATTAIYARLNLDPVRTAVDTATAAMMKAGKVEDKPDDAGGVAG